MLLVVNVRVERLHVRHGGGRRDVAACVGGWVDVVVVVGESIGGCRDSSARGVKLGRKTAQGNCNFKRVRERERLRRMWKLVKSGIDQTIIESFLCLLS